MSAAAIINSLINSMESLLLPLTDRQIRRLHQGENNGTREDDRHHDGGDDCGRVIAHESTSFAAIYTLVT